MNPLLRRLSFAALALALTSPGVLAGESRPGQGAPAQGATLDAANAGSRKSSSAEVKQRGHPTGVDPRGEPAKIDGPAVSPRALLGGAGMITVALGFVVYAAVRRLGWGYLGLGVLFWVVTVALKFAWAIPFNTSIYQLTRSWPALVGNAAFDLYVGALTGVFEVGVTWLVLRYTRWGRATWNQALAFGIGFGAIEAFLLGLGSAAAVLGAILAPEVLPVELLRQLAHANDFLYGLAPISERFFTVLIHVFSNVLIFFAILRRRPGWFWLSFLYKTLIDAMATFVQLHGMEGLGQLWIVEAVVAIWGALGFLGSCWVRRHYPTEPPVDPGEAAIPSPSSSDA
jgi:uncharacterized membrane protein YhfC